MSLPKPYYEHGGITLYHGDCREILPLLPKVDLLLTDPPYGLNLGITNNQFNDSTHLKKKSYDQYVDSYENFVEEIVPRLNAAIDVADRAAVFTGPHIHEQRKPTAIGGIFHESATGRTPWGSKNFLPILFYGNPPNPGLHRPTVITSTARAEASSHPCPKPLPWIKWLVKLGSELNDIILDPFAGSSTTLRAAMDLGRKAIGIEISEKYCEIAAERLETARKYGQNAKLAPKIEILGQKSIFD